MLGTFPVCLLTWPWEDSIPPYILRSKGSDWSIDWSLSKSFPGLSENNRSKMLATKSRTVAWRFFFSCIGVSSFGFHMKKRRFTRCFTNQIAMPCMDSPIRKAKTRLVKPWRGINMASSWLLWMNSSPLGGNTPRKFNSSPLKNDGPGRRLTTSPIGSRPLFSSKLAVKLSGATQVFTNKNGGEIPWI